jgi:hypothetical protein
MMGGEELLDVCLPEASQARDVVWLSQLMKSTLFTQHVTLTGGPLVCPSSLK